MMKVKDVVGSTETSVRKNRLPVFLKLDGGEKQRRSVFLRRVCNWLPHDMTSHPEKKQSSLYGCDNLKTSETGVSLFCARGYFCP